MKDIRSFLQNELLERCRRNPKYSLRSFAKFLNVEPSALSKILHGRREISPKMLNRLAVKFEFSPDQLGFFEKEKQGKGVGDYQALEMDLFQIISDWYHYAILELTRVKGFRSDAGWVAKRLGITVNEVRIAVDRLLKAEMLEVDSAGRWQDVSGNVTTYSGESTAIALKRMQKQFLTKAIEALDETELSQRSQTSMTFAISTRRLAEAKKKILRFQRALSKYLESDANDLDQVYNLSISLYPLSKQGETK